MGLFLVITSHSPVHSQTQEIPSPEVLVKRELGDPNKGLSGGILLNEDLSTSYDFSPLVRGLGKTKREIKISGYTLKPDGDIAVNNTILSTLKLQNGEFISKYYLQSNVIIGYILHDFLPVTYHGSESFLSQIESFPNDCNEYLAAKVVPQTKRFDCYKKEHNDYVEEYIFEVVNEPNYIARTLVLDAFYPVSIKQNAKGEINRIFDLLITE